MLICKQNYSGAIAKPRIIKQTRSLEVDFVGKSLSDGASLWQIQPIPILAGLLQLYYGDRETFRSMDIWIAIFQHSEPICCLALTQYC
jgi:hypothetical protein